MPSEKSVFKKAQQKLLALNADAAEGGDDARLLWRKGFLYSRNRLYDFARYGYDAYLSDLQREMTILINGSAKAVLDNKLIFESVFKSVAPVSRAIVLAERGAITTLGDSEKLVAGAHGTSFYAKPVTGGGGSGVFRCTVDGSTVRYEGHQSDWEGFLEHLLSLKKPYIVCPEIRQHEALARIYPGATNTVRILMLRDPETQRPVIAAAVLRVGSDKTRGVDNFSRGGYSFEIDPGSGVLGRGASKSTGPDERIERHPDTGSRVTGELVPYWAEVLDCVSRTFQAFPAMKYVGWDVVVTDTGPVILEGNNYSDVHLLQVHRPLLVDPVVRRFYEHHGILRWTSPSIA